MAVNVSHGSIGIDRTELLKLRSVRYQAKIKRFLPLDLKHECVHVVHGVNPRPLDHVHARLGHADGDFRIGLRRPQVTLLGLVVNNHLLHGCERRRSGQSGSEKHSRESD